MEFLVFTLAALSAFIVLFQPKRERLAFIVLAVSFLITVGMFVIGTSVGYLPPVNV